MSIFTDIENWAKSLVTPKKDSSGNYVYPNQNPNVPPIHVDPKSGKAVSQTGSGVGPPATPAPGPVSSIDYGKHPNFNLGPVTITPGWAYLVAFGVFLWLGSTAFYGIPMAILVAAISYQVITIISSAPASGIPS